MTRVSDVSLCMAIIQRPRLSSGSLPLLRGSGRAGRTLRFQRRRRLRLCRADRDSRPHARVNRVDIKLLRGIDQARDILLANTERFTQGFAANNALLWGARGMGKSALIKAAHATINTRLAGSKALKPLKLIEIHREDIEGLPALMAQLRGKPWRFSFFATIFPSMAQIRATNR